MWKTCGLVVAELVLLLQKFKKEKDEERKEKKRKLHIFAAALMNLSRQSFHSCKLTVCSSRIVQLQLSSCGSHFQSVNYM